MLLNAMERFILSRLIIGAICLTVTLPCMAWERTIKLSPKMRITETATEAMPQKIQRLIKPFLKRDMVVDAQALNQYPYIVAFADDHIAAAKGEKVYVRGKLIPTMTSYSIIRLGDPYVDPVTKEVLGSSANYIATADLQTIGDPSTLTVSDVVGQIIIGDRLIPGTIPTAVDLNFTPHPAKARLQGMIIDILGIDEGFAQAGKYSAVVINRGAREGVQLGDVMSIYSPATMAEDKVVEGSKPVQLPSEKKGELMVFKVYDRLSFALITDTTTNVQVNDMIGTL